MEPTPENIKAFQHARWRVKFTAHLLRLHESLETKGTEHWKQEQAEYLNRHALALESLAFYPPEWDKLYP